MSKPRQETRPRPCPFCGSEPHSDYDGVRCQVCAVDVHADTVYDWNRRAIPECVKALVEALDAEPDLYYKIAEALTAVNEDYGGKP